MTTGTDEQLDAMALEFCHGAFGHMVTEERIKKHYAPLIRELLDASRALSPPQPSESRGLTDEVRRYIPDIVSNAMLTMWNEICADTNCHPLDIEQDFEGQKGHLGFTPRHWTRMTGNMVLANLDSYFAPPQPSERDAVLDGWQPIETAPKNLDVVLLYEPPSGVGQGHRTLDAHCGNPNAWQWVFQVTGYGCEPTHWQPLPAPPTLKSNPQGSGEK